MTPFQLMLHFVRNIESGGRTPPEMHLLVHDKDSTKEDGTVQAFDTDRREMNREVDKLPTGSRVRIMSLVPGPVRSMPAPAPAPAAEPSEPMTGGGELALAQVEEPPVQPVANSEEAKPRVRQR